MSHTGSCYCGAVTFEVEGPFRFVVHDHCSICRRISGAAFVTWAGVMREQLRLLTGAEMLTSFQATPEAERQFCGRCGSHLFFRSSRWPGEVHITRASIPGSISQQPKAHVFFSDRVDWIEVCDGLPRCGGATGMEPLDRT